MNRFGQGSPCPFVFYKKELPMSSGPILHPIPPVYDNFSRILILGSFPSVRSREEGFFYGHPRNRFWAVLAHLLDEPVPSSTDEKKAFLLRSRIAVWDVIRSCTVSGSSDSSIRDVVPNDLSCILSAADIREIFVNGRTAEKLYRTWIEPETGRPCVLLPSTSPANAAWNLDRLSENWSVILPMLKD